MFPMKYPEFPISEISKPTCSYEDGVKEREKCREFDELLTKCHKAKSSRVYSKIMSLTGEYERITDI